MKTNYLKISAIAILSVLMASATISCSGGQQSGNQHDHSTLNQHDHARQSGQASVAALKAETFKVNGNCSMCEERIEAAALSVAGVGSADWDNNSKIIEIALDESKTNVHEVHKAIAKAGHDTEMHKANDADYNRLHTCCKYDRKTL
jgi:periplasmic mercuric ion binding protein